MENTLNKILLIFILPAIMMLGCSEDFLEQPPRNNYTVDSYWKNPNDATMAVNAAYNALAKFGAFNVGWLSFGDVAAEDMTDFDQNWHFVRIDQYTVDPATIWSDDNYPSTYDCFYMAIYRANWAIDNMGKIKNLDEDLKHRLTNEAKFIRAISYFYLVNIWGAVPFYIHNLSPDEAFSISRTPAGEVYQQIIRDLQDAAGLNQKIPGLPTKENTPLGRVTKGAALSLLARTYLYLENYTEAERIAKMVIESGEYELVDDYGLNWDNMSGWNSDESIFPILFKANGPYPRWMSNTGAAITTFTADARFSPDNTGFIILYPADGFADVHQEGDLRLEMNVFQHGDTFHLGRDGQKIYQAHGNTDEGLLLAKYIRRNHIVEVNQQSDYDNELPVPVIRYSEVLLICSEACYKNGKEDEALLYLNQVRRRAFGFDPGGDDTSVDITASDDYWAALEYERRIELFAECHRFFDLRRWDLLEERLGPLGYRPETLGLFPFPQLEIDKNPNLAPNNPGY